MAYFHWSAAAIQAFEAILAEEGILQSRMNSFHIITGHMVRAGYIRHGVHPTEIASDSRQEASTLLTTEKGRAAYEAHQARYAA